MPVDLVLHNAKICTSRGLLEGGLAIDGERIVRIAKETNLPQASTNLDVKGNLVIPGLIDSHVHLRDQELSYREDFFSGTSAAAAGGITTAIDMPNNRPLTMDLKSLRDRIETARSRILVNVAFNSAFPRLMEEIRQIVSEGAVAFKLYLLQQIGGLNINEDDEIVQALRICREINVPVAVHAEDAATLEMARKEMLKAGRADLPAFLKAHPQEAEVKAIERMVRLAGRSGAHIHFCHVSSAIGLSKALRAKARGLSVSIEVTPQHLLLTSRDWRKLGNLALTIPPLRTKSDTEHLWKALHQGSIDVVASDHAPHSLEEKSATSVWDAKPGVVGLETMLPLLLTEANRGRLSISELVRLTSEKPAEIFSLKDRGNLKQGSFADVVVVDIKREHKIDASRFHSKAKFSPFDSWSVKGKPVKTFVNGQLVMEEDEIVAKPRVGHVIRQ